MNADKRLSLLLLAAALLTACAERPRAPRLLRPSWSAAGSDPAGQFGMRAMTAGDVNHDGFDDLVVGAPKWKQGRGQASLYLGSAQGLATTPAWATDGEGEGELWGDRVGQAGDLNRDGYDDVFVAAPGWRGGLGRVAVFHGSVRGLAAKPSWSATPSEMGELFGDCTHPTGDVDGDGFDDLAVGAYGHDHNRGRVLLYRGSTKGLGARPHWQGLGEAPHDWYGYGVGAAGDVNRDGYADLLAGAKYNDQAGEDAGKAYLYLGSKTGPGLAPDWQSLGSRPRANTSVRVSVAGDVNGDGFDDVFVSAPGVDGSFGELAVYFGGASGPGPKPDQRLWGPALGMEFFGQGACPAGDLDGDGFDDVAVHGRSGQGRGHALIFRGSAQGLEPRPAWQVDGEGLADRFAWWLAPAGDVDGDGLADLVISAESQGPGRVFVVLGRQARESLGSSASATKPSICRQKGYLRRKD